MKNSNLCYTGKRQNTGERNNQSDMNERRPQGRGFPGAGLCAQSERNIPAKFCMRTKARSCPLTSLFCPYAGEWQGNHSTVLP